METGDSRRRRRWRAGSRAGTGGARTPKDRGVPVPEVVKKLTVKTGKNAGQHPSVASVYRALAEARKPTPGSPRTSSAPGTVSPEQRWSECTGPRRRGRSGSVITCYMVRAFMHYDR
ncbi:MULTISPECIES: hypothetical protein [unclassified Streptomyces]|uniref:hypothetical protein n=1 Tax=unclassified Streptomyces TaxID=2593676 RepID=UPI00093D030A|nr:hypothetical protein [Streptomyces sp. CB02400]OKK08791.1 hypothetical protein AMK33_17830 [Streptomyces sp. CB02400]